MDCTMDPFQTCDNLLNCVKSSNLNFSLSETPFAVSISLKKTFVRDKTGALKTPSPNFHCCHFNKPTNIDGNQIFLLETANEALKANVVQHKTELDAFREANHELDLNLQKAKVEILDIMSEKNQLVQAKNVTEKDLHRKQSEIKEIKDFTRTLKAEIENLKKEINSSSKALKSKEKDINILSSKNDNLSENLTRIKKENSTLVVEKNEAAKKYLKIEKKLRKTKSSAPSLTRSTNTPLYSSLSVSTNTTLFSTPNVSSNPPIDLHFNKSPSSPCLPSTSKLGGNLISTCQTSALPTPFTTMMTTTSTPPSSATSTPSNLSSTLCSVHPLQPSLSSTSSTTYSLSSSTPSSNPNCISSTSFIPRNLSSRSIPSSIRCEHSPQCVSRQPRSAPLPSITFLVNERSKYHQHMMEWSREEFAGCWKCFSVDNENYGCRECVWLKWWLKWHGELHGFPDIGPWIYKKYL